MIRTLTSSHRLTTILKPVGRGGGCDGCARTPSQAAEVHFFVDQRFGRLELGTLLKDHDDQHYRSSWFAAAKPVNNTDFQLHFYFCSF